MAFHMQLFLIISPIIPAHFLFLFLIYYLIHLIFIQVSSAYLFLFHKQLSPYHPPFLRYDRHHELFCPKEKLARFSIDVAYLLGEFSEWKHPSRGNKHRVCRIQRK
jgi:hypothetical protein